VYSVARRSAQSFLRLPKSDWYDGRSTPQAKLFRFRWSPFPFGDCTQPPHSSFCRCKLSKFQDRVGHGHWQSTDKIPSSGSSTEP
jgi:hypothetical protein